MTIRIKPRFFIFLALLIGVIIAVVYLKVQNPKEEIVLKTPEGERAEVVTTANTADPEVQDALTRLKNTYKDKLTIIFFYDGYENQKLAHAYIDILKEAVAPLEPFASSKDYLLYKSFTTDSQKCSVKNNALICDEQLIESFKALGVEHFKLVILSPLDFESRVEDARGKNSWMTVSTDKKNMPDEEFNRFLGAQFAQFVGRSLGLSVEASATPSANLQNVTPKKPNCAGSVEEAQVFWGAYIPEFEGVSFFPGCRGSASHYYPEKGTLMSDAPEKESYGVVSEDFLRGVLQCFYGNKEAISYPAGRKIVNLNQARNCAAFKEQYPDFWSE